MRGVLLCGGTGSRLRPLTNVLNKHLVAVRDKCMIQYPLETLTDAGIKDILVITGGEHLGAFLEFLGSGSNFGCRITYKVQDKPAGIADAIRYAQDFVRDEKFVVINGDNYFGSDISPVLNEWVDGAMCLVVKSDRWRDSGVVKIENGRITEIVEKPKEFISDLLLTGLYCLTHEAFPALSELTPSERGEYEITDLLKWYLSKNKLFYRIYDGFWSDMGTFEGIDRVLKAGR